MKETKPAEQWVNDPTIFCYLVQQFDHERDLLDFLLESESFETFQWSREPDDTEEFWDCEEWEFFDRRSGRKLNRILLQLGLTPIPSNEFPDLEKITLAEYVKGNITEGHGASLIAGGDRLRFREKITRWLSANPNSSLR